MVFNVWPRHGTQKLQLSVSGQSYQNHAKLPAAGLGFASRPQPLTEVSEAPMQSHKAPGGSFESLRIDQRKS